MRKIMLLAVASLLLMGCDSGKKQLEERVQLLERENTALKAERDALKIQMGAVAAAGAAQQQAANESATRSAAQSYARRCATALEILKIDASDMKLPAALNGRSCNDPLLGGDAVEPTYGVASSSIRLGEDSKSYVITVTDTANQTYTQDSP